jgi:hypothetical protein
LSSHRILFKKPSKLTMAIAAGGVAVVAAGSTATVAAWPGGASAGAATTTDFIPGAGHGASGLSAGRMTAELQTFKAKAAWQTQLNLAAQAERAAAARRAAQKAAAARKAAAAQAAALAAQQQAASQPAQAQAPAPQPVAPPQPSGSAQQIAMAMLGSYGWPASQFSCLNALWARESGWNVYAANPDGAYGIPQALPGSKMASAGADWQTNAATQIRWGLGYIKGLYGSPCGAWAHSQATGWY